MKKYLLILAAILLTSGDLAYAKHKDEKKLNTAPHAIGKGARRRDPAGKVWETNLDKAMREAQRTNRHILLVFSGSDWCPPCKALHKNIFESTHFKKFADKHLILLMADFPRRTKQAPDVKRDAEKMMQKYEVSGFPTLYILDKNGQVVDKHVGYNGAMPDDFVPKLRRRIR